MTAEAHGPGLGWKLGHSAWMVPALIGFGIFSWVSFAYVAARTRRQSLIALAVVFFIASAVASFWPEGLENTQAGLLVFVWAAGVVAAFVVNPSWLRWRWEHRGSYGFSSGPANPPRPSGPQDDVPPGREGPSGPVFGQDGRWHSPE